MTWYKIVHYHDEDGYDGDGGPCAEMESFCKLLNLFSWGNP